MKKQPLPKKGKKAVTVEVIKDLKSRRKAGKAKYGRVLETFNGRDALLDAYEEVLDLAQYLKQAIMERTEKRARQYAYQRACTSGSVVSRTSCKKCKSHVCPRVPTSITEFFSSPPGRD